jgi:hypothetical protein
MSEPTEGQGSPPSTQSWPDPQSANQPVVGAATRQQLRATLPVQPVLTADLLRERQQAFPPQGQVEYERSVIRIPFQLKRPAAGEEGRNVDVMAFDAYMRLLRMEPTVNGLGLRQFEFFIDAWELTNTYSKGLNADVTFTLSDTAQPRSLCIALQREADYPAIIFYSAIYDIYLGNERILERQPGVAVATPVREIPPRNVTVAFEKPFDSELFSFAAGTCEGMRSITADEFEAGAVQARRIRGQA